MRLKKASEAPRNWDISGNNNQISLTPTPTQPSTNLQTINTPTSVPIPRTNTPYKDGTYTGIPADAIYGNIQVRTTIANGRITNVQFLQYPKDQSTSYSINQYADPKLAEEAIQSQSANVDIITSATLSSNAFIQSLQSTLTQAKNQ